MTTETYLEESVTMCDAAKRVAMNKKIIFTILTVFLAISGVVSAVISLLSSFTLWAFVIVFAVCLIVGILLNQKRNSFLFDCDYIFVDGSLRIAKVLGQSTRKPLAVLECKQIIAIGKYNSEQFKQHQANKEIKQLIATPNIHYHDDQIYYLFYTNHGIQTLLMVEASNLFLLTLSKNCDKKNIFIA